MRFVKSLRLVCFVTAATVVSAMPGMNRRTVTNGTLMRETSCHNYTGDCYLDDCQPTFHNPDDTTGYCTSGKFKKCPCNKCTTKYGELFCNDEDCDVGWPMGTCSTSLYLGCPCVSTEIDPP